MGMHMLCRVYPATSVRCPDLEEIPESTAICAVINTNQLGRWSPEEICSQQLQDEEVGSVLQARDKN